MGRTENSKNFVDTAVTLPQYLVLTGGPTLQVGLHRNGKLPDRAPCKGKSSRRKHFMATKKKAAKKKKKH